MNQTPEFKKAHLQLKHKSDWKFSIELYHKDFSAEPFFQSESKPEKIILNHVDEHGLIITIMTPETMISFSERNWMAHTDEDYVSFGSQRHNDTYCVIHFC